MLDMDRLENSIKVNDRHSFCLTTNLLSVSTAKELYQSYPKLSFTKSVRDTGEKKHYKFDILPIISNNKKTEKYDLLSMLWKKFISSITDPEYIRCLLNSFNRNADGYYVNIGFYVYERGGWIAPHIDNEGKYFTQIFYFNPFWDISWGGNLHLLASSNPSDIIFSVPPLSMYTATIFRSKRAWHMVDAITDKSHSKRLSLQLEVLEI